MPLSSLSLIISSLDINPVHPCRLEGIQSGMKYQDIHVYTTIQHYHWDEQGTYQSTTRFKEPLFRPGVRL